MKRHPDVKMIKSRWRAALGACSILLAAAANPVLAESPAWVVNLPAICTAENDGLPLGISYRVVAKYPHRPGAFTQGLQFHDDHLYEGTGMVGESSLARIDLESGAVLRETMLDPPYFGEGISVLDNSIYQLTWKLGKVFRYDLESLDQKESFTIEGEGWGLTSDGTHLITSTGSASLTWYNEKLEAQKTVEVTVNGRPVEKLNELEWYDGCILANVLGSNDLVLINPVDGKINGILNLSHLTRHEMKLGEINVANGVAIRRSGEWPTLLVTGKYWRNIYELLPVVAPGTR